MRPVILHNFGGRLKKGVVEECPPINNHIRHNNNNNMPNNHTGHNFYSNGIHGTLQSFSEKKMSFRWSGLLGNDAQRNVEI